MATKRNGSPRGMLQACGLVLAGTAGLASAQVYQGPAGTPTAPVAYYDGAPLAAVPQDAPVNIPMTGTPNAMPGTVVQGMPAPGIAQGMPVSGVPADANGGCLACGLFGGGVSQRGNACGSGTCHSDCTIDRWIVGVDGVALFRARGRSLGLGGIQLLPPDGPIDLQNQNKQFSVAPAMRFTFGRTLPKLSNCDIGMELTALTSFGFNNRDQVVVAPPGGALVGGVLDVLNNENGVVGAAAGRFVRTAISARNSSSLNGFEANGKLDYYLDGSTVLLAGLRYVRLYDKLDIQETGFVGANPVNAFREARLNNNMFGIQLGTESHRGLSDKLSLNYGFKAGLLGNIMDGEISQASSFVAGGGAYARAFDVSRTKATGLIEFGIGADYKLREKLNLRAGYQLLFLSNVGTGLRAPVPSFAGGDIGRLSSSGVLYNGAFVGLEWHWGCCN